MKKLDILKSIKKTTGATSVDKSTMANVTEFFDTGSYALNRVLGGDLKNGGVPSGRVVTFFGASGSGKSLIAAITAARALKSGKIDVVYIFDSEGGSLINVFKQYGVDLDRVQHIPVKSVEHCTTKMVQTYDMLVEAHQSYLDDPDNNDDVRAICILDSLGALASDKLANDAVNKDKTSMDMGIGAKMKNNMMRGLMMRAVMSNCTLIVINHEYQDPGAMFASKIHNMAGGKAIEYGSHIILQCEKLLIKANDTEWLTGKETEEQDVGFFKGNKIRFFTTKNRVIKPGYTATVYVDFNTGISKYDGLIEDAVKYGFLEEVRGGYICKSYSDKRVTYKDLVQKDEIWNTFIDDFNKKSIEAMSYSNSIADEVSEIEDSLEDDPE